MIEHELADVLGRIRIAGVGIEDVDGKIQPAGGEALVARTHARKVADLKSDSELRQEKIGSLARVANGIEIVLEPLRNCRSHASFEASFRIINCDGRDD